VEWAKWWRCRRSVGVGNMNDLIKISENIYVLLVVIIGYPFVAYLVAALISYTLAQRIDSKKYSLHKNNERRYTVCAHIANKILPIVVAIFAIVPIINILTNIVISKSKLHLIDISVIIGCVILISSICFYKTINKQNFRNEFKKRKFWRDSLRESNKGDKGRD
jgi:hypothetical protein